LKRVLVIINKWWECDPALAAMLSDNTRPKSSPWPTDLQPTRPVPDPSNLPKDTAPKPRATFVYKTFNAEVWCVSDLIEDLPPECQSSSSSKAARLGRPFAAGAAPDLVIAVGTAGSCSETPNRNGWVTIGTAVFMHNAHPNGFPNPFSKWGGPFDQLIESHINPELFTQIAFFDSGSAITHFLPVPLNPSDSPNISIGYGDVALGTLNVTDYTQYTILDPRTVKAFTEADLPNKPVSLETTHGLIRMQCEASKSPFLFVSGITDRLGFFNTDDAPRSDAQNTAAAHNAGVAVTWLLPALDKAWGATPSAAPAPRSPVTTCLGCEETAECAD
jgi:hypothetical protein